MVMEVLSSVGAQSAAEAEGKRKEGGGPGVVVPVDRWGDSLETLWGTEHRSVCCDKEWLWLASVVGDD